MTIRGLKIIEKTTWNSIFQTWQESEGIRREWQRSAQEKGWGSWEQWRSSWVSHFNAQNRPWSRYRILDPLTTVPQFRVGPTQAWQKHFAEAEQNHHNFATLVQQVDYSDKYKIQEMLKKFPSPTEFIGIIMTDKSITLIEGHHRATTIAFAAQKGVPLDISTPTIALTQFRKGEELLLDSMLARGSHRES